MNFFFFFFLSQHWNLLSFLPLKPYPLPIRFVFGEEILWECGKKKLEHIESYEHDTELSWPHANATGIGKGKVLVRSWVLLHTAYVRQV